MTDTMTYAAAEATTWLVSDGTLEVTIWRDPAIRGLRVTAFQLGQVAVLDGEAGSTLERATRVAHTMLADLKERAAALAVVAAIEDRYRSKPAAS